MITVYLFSGLGADYRAFRYLDLSGFHVVHIPWITPLAHEHIESYAKRLSAPITAPNAILIGLSFGGILAIEVAKQVAVHGIILLASIKNYSELPFYYRWIGKLRLHHLVPTSWLAKPHFWSAWIFGAKTKAEKKLMATILKDTDIPFLTWALDVILSWKNTEIPNRLIHIHGTKDRLLPLRFVNADIIIDGGEHLMTINKAKEVSKAIRHAIVHFFPTVYPPKCSESDVIKRSI
ncbi:hypothetical protein GCM10023231_19780 [Olivibacter ginsenosidimutans]|uniref:AB hydrolase-1 domain-containing protein n=1 Tax=Olivibacter ginsenosidimutans TaxID=1176537 RepID=A0ABP9B7Y3_9SPHI